MKNIRKQVLDALMEIIMNESFQIGDRLPSEMALASQLDVTHANARFVIKMLESNGVVSSNKRGGTVLLKKLDAPVVRELKAAFSRIVHIVANPEKANSFHWNDVTLRVLERTLSENDYVTRRHALPRDGISRELLESFMRGIAEEGSAALVILPRLNEEILFTNNADLLFQYHQNIFMLASGGQPLDLCPFNILCLDPFLEGVKAAEHLVAKGVRHVIYLDSGKMAARWSQERYRGLVWGFQRKTDHQDVVEKLVVPDMDHYQKVIERIKRNGDRPCLALPNIQQAARFAEVAREYQLTHPDDFRLVTFNDLPEYLQWNFTTVTPPFEAIGEHLATLIIDGKSRRRFGSSARIAMEPDLIERGSA